LAYFLEDSFQSVLSALECRCESSFESHPFQGFPRLVRFFDPLGDNGTSTQPVKPVFQVPLGLAVSNKDQLSRHD